MLIATALVYAILSKLMNTYLPRFIRRISYQAYNAADKDSLLKWRRLETFVQVFITSLKAILFLLILYFFWCRLNPNGSSFAIITASAAAVVLLSSSVGSLLRDVASGTAMIVEGWYNVGDHVQIEPFQNMRGIVEAVTLRSTTIRGLSGEIIKVNNQNIQGIRMTPMGVKSLALDVFVSNLQEGKKIVEGVLNAVPKDATMIKEKFVITETQKLSSKLWRITATGKTVAGREWLIEDFATSAIKEADQDQKIIVHGPIVRFADASAEKRFKRSVRSDHT